MDDITIIKEETSQDGAKVIYAQPSARICARQIAVAVKDGVVLQAAFMGGCSGNTQGVAALVAGMKVEDAISRLEGINCGGKGTSCPDQLSKVLRAAVK